MYAKSITAKKISNNRAICQSIDSSFPAWTLNLIN